MLAIFCVRAFEIYSSQFWNVQYFIINYTYHIVQ